MIKYYLETAKKEIKVTKKTSFAKRAICFLEEIDKAIYYVEDCDVKNKKKKVIKISSKIYDYIFIEKQNVVTSLVFKSFKKQIINHLVPFIIELIVSKNEKASWNLPYKIEDGDEKFSLPDFHIEESMSAQAAEQSFGWAIEKFNLKKVWEISQGEGIKIAILDSGCDLDHPDLKCNLLPGINFINPSEPPIDRCKHGTHVSGIIAACNNEIGMVGIAPMAKIIPVKVLDDKGNGNLQSVIKGIKWATINKADIICMSLGTPMPNQLLHNIIKYATSNGVIVFAASGNSGMTKSVFYPSAFPECISIGSACEKMNRSKFSNTGHDLDFLAPGENIFSTIPDDWYGVMNGTSMACPFAAGFAAIILSYIKKNNIKIKFSKSHEVISVMKELCTDVSDQNKDKFMQGNGILNPSKFLEWIEKNKN